MEPPIQANLAGQVWGRYYPAMHEAVEPTVPDVATIREAVHGVCKEKHVARVDLFGSVAKGCASAGSDVDLLIEFQPEANAGLFEMAR